MGAIGAWSRFETAVAWPRFETVAIGANLKQQWPGLGQTSVHKFIPAENEKSDLGILSWII